MQLTFISELLYKFWNVLEFIYQQIGSKLQQTTPDDQLDFDSFYDKHLSNGFSHCYDHLNDEKYESLVQKTNLYFLKFEEIFALDQKDFDDFFNFHRQYFYKVKVYQLRNLSETAELRKNFDIYLSFLQCVYLFNRTINYMHSVVNQDYPSTEQFSPVERKLYKLLFTSEDKTGTFYGIEPKFRLLKRIENYDFRERKIIYAAEIDFLSKKLESRFANFFEKYKKYTESYSYKTWFHYISDHFVTGMSFMASYLKTKLEDPEFINYEGLKPMLGYLREKGEISYSEDGQDK